MRKDGTKCVLVHIGSKIVILADLFANFSLDLDFAIYVGKLNKIIYITKSQDNTCLYS